MKALIIDPALHSLGGHHFTAVQRLQAEFARLHIEAPCLGSIYASRHVQQELDCTPTFSRSVYGRSYASTDEFDEAIDETVRQIEQAMRRRDMPALIVLPCCDQVLAAALARHVGRRRRSARPRILLWLLYGPHHLKAPDDPESAGLLSESRWAFVELAEAADVRAYCETPTMAGFYRGLLEFDVGVAPGPGLASDGRFPRPADRPPVVSCIGFANRAKGYRLLPQAVQQVLQQRRDTRFMIHGIFKGSDAEADAPIADLLAELGDRVSVDQDVLSSDEYLARLAETDLLLLPYDPHVYRWRGSGVFSDAHQWGIPVVAPKDCAFAQPAFDGGWGVAMEDYGSDALGVAILTALDRLETLRANAAQAAGRIGNELDRLLAGFLRGSVVKSS